MYGRNGHCGLMLGVSPLNQTREMSRVTPHLQELESIQGAWCRTVRPQDKSQRRLLSGVAAHCLENRSCLVIKGDPVSRNETGISTGSMMSLPCVLGFPWNFWESCSWKRPLPEWGPEAGPLQLNDDTGQRAILSAFFFFFFFRLYFLS